MDTWGFDSDESVPMDIGYSDDIGTSESGSQFSLELDREYRGLAEENQARWLGYVNYEPVIHADVSNHDIHRTTVKVGKLTL